MDLTVKCGLPAATAAFLTLWLAVAPPPAAAQDVCSLLDQIVEAGEQDNPPFSSLKHFALPKAECGPIGSGANRGGFGCRWAHRFAIPGDVRKIQKLDRECERLDEEVWEMDDEVDEAIDEWTDAEDWEEDELYAIMKKVEAEQEQIEAKRDQVCGHRDQLIDRLYASALPDAETLAASIKQCFHADKIRGSWEPLDRSEYRGGRPGIRWYSNNDRVGLGLHISGSSINGLNFSLSFTRME